MDQICFVGKIYSTVLLLNEIIKEGDVIVLKQIGLMHISLVLAFDGIQIV